MLRSFAALQAFAVVCAVLSPVTGFANDVAQLQAAKRAIVTRHPDTALQIWEALAQKGNSEAQFQLAVALRQGKWVPRNPSRAAQLLQQAAMNKHQRAQFVLAEVLESGDGVAQDLSAANVWYRRAAEQGYRPAQRKLEHSTTEADGADLIGAVRRDDLAEVRRLLAAGHSPNQHDEDNRSPYLVAASQGSTSILQVLADAGANTQAKDDFGNTALLLAVRGGHYQTVRELADRRVHLNAADSRGNTPLLSAVRRKDTPIVRLLLAAGASANMPNHDGHTPLSLAEQLGDQLLIRTLREFGAKTAQVAKVRQQKERVDPNRAQSPVDGWPPLSVAAWRGQVDIVQTLLKRGARIDATDDAGATALLRAAENGQAKVVALLLLRGANRRVVSPVNGRTPLLSAAAGGHAETLLVLLDGDLQARDAENNGVFALAVRSGDEPSVLLLLEKAPQTVDDVALAKLIGAGMDEASRRLLSRGTKQAVDLDAALVAAMAKGLEPLSIDLLGRGANANAWDSGVPVLEMAIAQNRPQLVRALLEAGANMNVPGHTPALVLAAFAGSRDICRMLLARGADVDVRDHLKNTPLIAAVKEGHVETAKVLLSEGADRRLRNRDGDNAISIARDAKNEELRAVLETRGDTFFSNWGNE